MKELMCLSTSEGVGVNIIEESAMFYRPIGIYLLNDESGNRVDIIEHDAMGRVETIVAKIYKKWMNENPNSSWTILTECFRACGLNQLASKIEKHFEIPPPIPQGRASYGDICCQSQCMEFIVL